INWRTRSYMMWVAAGAFMGTLSGFLYNRAAREYAERNGDNPPRPGTLELVGLLVAAIAIVRQATELGRPDEENK
ncbi:MAG: hypothetical protein AAF125_06595, partial [Chloroflexota bacterium]